MWACLPLAVASCSQPNNEQSADNSPSAVEAPVASSNQCLDASKGEPQQLTGVLRRAVFPGPPNYESVEQGDSPQTAFILNLPQTICVSGDEFIDSNKRFSTVHIIGTNGLEGALDQTVTVNVRSSYGAHTGHHHAPLVVEPASIQLANGTMLDMASPPTLPLQRQEPAERICLRYWATEPNVQVVSIEPDMSNSDPSSPSWNVKTSTWRQPPGSSGSWTSGNPWKVNCNTNWISAGVGFRCEAC